MPQHDAVWSALSHPARRLLLDALRERPATTGALHAVLDDAGLSPSRFATQRHLQVLREADLVLVTDRGRERLNALNASALYQATVGWLDPTSARTAHSLDSLKRLAEAPANTAKEQTVSTETTAIEHLLVEQAIDIDAPPARVWRAITAETQAWWQPPFTLLSDASDAVTVRFPERIGEPVVEHDGERQAAWGELVELEPGVALAYTSRVCGADAATGTVRIRLDAAAGSSRVTMRQEAIGAFHPAVRPGVERGWASKLELLAEHCAKVAA